MLGHKARKLSKELEQCISDCWNCHRMCQLTTFYCLDLGDEHAETDHIRLLQDCAAICQTSADFMLRGSDMHGPICNVCADVCERCALDCERFNNDVQMETCADVCRRCEESCRQMAIKEAA